MYLKTRINTEVLETCHRYGYLVPCVLFIFGLLFYILNVKDQENNQRILSEVIIARAPSQDDVNLMVRFEDLTFQPNIQPVQEVMPHPPKIISYGGRKYIEFKPGIYQAEDGSFWKKITVTTTAYTWIDDGFNTSIGAGDGRTSIGKCAIKSYGIAADPKALPYGSVVHVAGYGIHKVDDTGGAMRRSYRKKGEIQLDLRIPQVSANGNWRSINTCQKIARKHGRQEDRTVLLKIEKEDI